MIRGKNQDHGFRIFLKDITEGQKHAWGRSAVLRLLNGPAERRARGGRPQKRPMTFANDSDRLLRRDQGCHAIHRVFQHRPRSYKRAVLFWAGFPQPPRNEGAHAVAAASCQDNCPLRYGAACSFRLPCVQARRADRFTRSHRRIPLPSAVFVSRAYRGWADWPTTSCTIARRSSTSKGLSRTATAPDSLALI
jgi:hypothetical protein